MVVNHLKNAGQTRSRHQGSKNVPGESRNITNLYKIWWVPRNSLHHVKLQGAKKQTESELSSPSLLTSPVRNVFTKRSLAISSRCIAHDSGPKMQAHEARDRGLWVPTVFLMDHPANTALSNRRCLPRYGFTLAARHLSDSFPVCTILRLLDTDHSIRSRPMGPSGWCPTVRSDFCR